METIEEFIKRSKETDPNSDNIVLAFIYNFIHKEAHSDRECELIRSLFMNGYCYYFAHMLQLAFNRGFVYWCAPFGHFVWIDPCTGTPYDIEGVSTAESWYYIPEYYIEDGVKDFKHVPGEIFDASQEYIDSVIAKFVEENACCVVKKEE